MVERSCPPRQLIGHGCHAGSRPARACAAGSPPLPLPAKIRIRLPEPIELDDDPERANDNQYAQRIYSEAEHVLRHGVNDLAKKRRLPIFF